MSLISAAAFVGLRFFTTFAQECRKEDGMRKHVLDYRADVANYDAAVLKSQGFSAPDLRSTAPERFPWHVLFRAGYSLEDLRQAGMPTGTKVEFKGTYSCQIYATFEYITADGERVEYLSYDSDNSTFPWSKGYGFDMTLPAELGIKKLKVKFDVWGGRPLKAVDRTKNDLPWRLDDKGCGFQEVFEIEQPADDAVLKFAASGTSLFAYLHEATYNGEAIAGTLP